VILPVPSFFNHTSSKIVGEKGFVYTLDNYPFAVKRVQEKVRKEGIENIETIFADATKTELPDKSIDVAFLFGFVHRIKILTYSNSFFRLFIL